MIFSKSSARCVMVTVSLSTRLSSSSLERKSIFLLPEEDDFSRFKSVEDWKAIILSYVCDVYTLSLANVLDPRH